VSDETSPLYEPALAPLRAAPSVPDVDARLQLVLDRLAADGRSSPAAPTAAPRADPDLEVLQLLGRLVHSYLELTARYQQVQHQNRLLEHALAHDPLTGLANRTHLLDRLEHALAKARRTRSVLALLYIDVDGFKQVNDSFGHQSGDLALREIASRLRATARQVDTVARMSGDEFVVLCEDLAGPGREVSTWLEAFAQRFVDALGTPCLRDQHYVVVSISVGAVITTGADGRGAGELLRDADDAMYAAKQAGGARLVVRRPRRAPRVARPPAVRAAP
jgi:diguanylate cyclase (GGDEF)-like protein